jgi:glutamate/tyrosine decarboxylase-like PLP-dependent enzyme
MTDRDLPDSSTAPRRGAPTKAEVPLVLSGAEFRAIGHELVDRIGEFLDTLPERPVTRGHAPDAVRAMIDADARLPDSGTDPAALMRSTTDLLFEHSLFNGHPRFHGYITSPPAPIGVLGDLLASAINQNVGAWTLSPVATEIEEQTVRWIADLVGYPPGGGGVLVSGGNMGNFVGVLAARAARADWPIRESGLTGAGARALRIYVSAETHTWIQKAADLFGFGTDAIRWIPTDADLRMDVAALRAQIARDRQAGDLPLMVVGTAGSVSTGAIDPLHDIADICSEFGLWFHVDGAYGGLAVAAPGTPEDLSGLRRADSVALDPHKWLYAPLEAGCTLVRDANTLRQAFAYHPPYYHFGVEATNFVDVGPQNSRGFRALKVWLALRHVGRDGYVRMIADDIRLAAYLYRLVDAHPEFEALTHGLSITTFRYVPADLAAGDPAKREAYLRELNTALLDRSQVSGAAFVSPAVVHGTYALRMCIVNFNTRAADMEALPEILASMGRAIHDELRAAAGM